MACNFIKKRLQHRCFPVEFAKFLRTPFFLVRWWMLGKGIAEVSLLLWKRKLRIQRGGRGGKGLEKIWVVFNSILWTITDLAMPWKAVHVSSLCSLKSSLHKLPEMWIADLQSATINYGKLFFLLFLKYFVDPGLFGPLASAGRFI